MTTVNPQHVMPRGKEPAPGAGLSQGFSGLLPVTAQQQDSQSLTDVRMGMGSDTLGLAGNGSLDGRFGGDVGVTVTATAAAGADATTTAAAAAAVDARTTAAAANARTTTADGSGGEGSMPFLDESSLFDADGRFVDPSMEGPALGALAARTGIDVDVNVEDDDEEEEREESPRL
ncbi:hypothetical protein CERZMDRAFT_91247 [Cercospora zeae-maydis SCOH1-5]|uniref:Uncharacterized protein n=1 Tax=Cercospora zeae-maydis SCOH1-5 TaxID=717836 RepID=A0A6A6F9S8_9PEZI|nr:hypothetical protein CERZMDRAFT_91247 [Cercospora zeae-maydis SCOH1-5]